MTTFWIYEHWAEFEYRIYFLWDAAVLCPLEAVDIYFGCSASTPPTLSVYMFDAKRGTGGGVAAAARQRLHNITIA